MSRSEQQEINCNTVLGVLIAAKDKNAESEGWMTIPAILGELGTGHSNLDRLIFALSYLASEELIESRQDPAAQEAHANDNKQYRAAENKLSEIRRALAESRVIVHHRRKRHLRRPAS